MEDYEKATNGGTDDEDDPNYTYVDGDSSGSEELSDFIDSDNDFNDIFVVKENDEALALQGVHRDLHDQGNIGSDLVGFGFVGVDSEHEKSDALQSIDSDSESDREDLPKFKEFNEGIDMKGKINLEVGMKFADFKVCRKALYEYTIQQGRDITVTHNQKERLSAHCKKKCGWKFHATPSQDKTTFQIKTLVDKHGCTIDYFNKKVTAKWVGKKYVEYFRDSPDWSATALIGALQRDHKVIIELPKAYRAKDYALKLVYGEEGEQYSKLWAYCAAIKQHNPGSTMLVEIENCIFRRLYVCLDALKKGFLSGCRKVVALDGCHLKSRFGGQLLCAVGMDANNNIFPIAWAVVEVENKSSWTWFLRNLLDDIGDIGWTFISDQQKGLVESFKDIRHNMDHRFCLRHLYANFKKLYPGKNLKDAMWNAARATTIEEFEVIMKEIEKIDNGASKWLRKHETYLWCKHAHNSDKKCDMLLNNLAESFNAYIKEARDKPIITMLEIIRRKLMKRLHDKREGMLKYQGEVCPRAIEKLEKMKEISMNYIAYVAGDGKFEVKHCWGTQFKVDLRLETCSCRKWQLTGLPCAHAVCAIFSEGGKPESYVNAVYSKETFLSAYQYFINPIPGENFWPQTNFNPITPPMARRMPGRPKKARRKEEGEKKNPHKKPRRGSKVHCGNCQGEGHNLKSCKAPPNPNRKIQRKKNKSSSSSVLTRENGKIEKQTKSSTYKKNE